MSLLPINRYWGDESQPSQQKTDGLQNLLAKIEERTKRRQAQKASAKKVAATLKKDEALERTLDADDLSAKLKRNSVDHDGEEPIIKKSKLQDEILDPDIERVTSPQKPAGSKSSSHGVENSNFTIIKGVEPKKARKVKCILPSWLANPSVVSQDLKNLNVSVTDIRGLDECVITQLKRNKVTHFFPVQSQLIPWLLECHSKYKRYWPRDVCVSAPTGSGKTLAFVLPIVQLLKNRYVREIGALVVLPTKDLSFQVYKVFKQYLKGTHLKAIHLGNGTLEKEKSKIVAKDVLRGHRSLVDIVVTTPGRLVEHLKYTEGFSLSCLRFLIIDEADHVMDSVQNDWLTHLHPRMPPFSGSSEVSYLTLSNIRKRPPRTQKLLFSATLSQDPEKLKQLNLFQPRLFTSVVKTDNVTTDEKSGFENHANEFIGRFSIPAELDEYYAVCPLSIKPLVLYHHIRKNSWKRVLCFADSVANVHKLHTLLKEFIKLDQDGASLNVVEISSKLAPSDHREILERFTKNSIDILVTTDTLARGIDLQNVDYVILYDAPRYVKNYIHRIGRTGRAGKKGTSLVLLTPDQKEHFDTILSTAGKTNVKEVPVAINDVRYLETVYKNALEALRSDLAAEKSGAMKHAKPRRKKIRKKKRTSQIQIPNKS